ncbi:hypothetical protein J3R04_002597 [Spirilliplanes yamanashiensis]|nr:hypothetical protein [Spirilliplanes yamanashiensis]
MQADTDLDGMVDRTGAEHDGVLDSDGTGSTW